MTSTAGGSEGSDDDAHGRVSAGGYLLERGSRANHVCAFARVVSEKSAIVIVPRLVCGLTNGEEILPCGEKVWNDTVVELSASWPIAKLHNTFTGEELSVEHRDGVPILPLSEILKTFPVACLGES